MERSKIRETMKIYIEEKDNEAVLERWRGAQAKVWLFHVSLNRLAISLFRDGEREAVYIVGIGCEHISGPFSWKGANLSIVIDPPGRPESLGRHRIIDKKAGFELLCAGVGIVQGPAAVPPNPFDGFLEPPAQNR
jgi:hypothetical protein